MDRAWRYDYGTWTTIESPVEFYDDQGEQLEAPTGYSTHTRWFGTEGELEVEVYSADDADSTIEAPAPYLAMIYNVGNNTERVFLENFPSLLQLLEEMSSALSLPNRGWDSGEDYELDETDDNV